MKQQKDYQNYQHYCTLTKQQKHSNRNLHVSMSNDNFQVQVKTIITLFSELDTIKFMNKKKYRN